MLHNITFQYETPCTNRMAIITLVLTSLSLLLQNSAFPEQKHWVHPSGFICCRSNVLWIHVSQFSPSTLVLHKHSAVSWNTIKSQKIYQKIWQNVSKNLSKISVTKSIKNLSNLSKNLSKHQSKNLSKKSFKKIFQKNLSKNLPKNYSEICHIIQKIYQKSFRSLLKYKLIEVIFIVITRFFFSMICNIIHILKRIFRKVAIFWKKILHSVQ